jgi:hypothetical protein
MIPFPIKTTAGIAVAIAISGLKIRQNCVTILGVCVCELGNPKNVESMTVCQVVINRCYEQFATSDFATSCYGFMVICDFITAFFISGVILHSTE